eukprot:CAMPEP_0172695862 /NCGR_PEP_ID=MMETSP1074-20121228/27645_1 /TAXON_ID=2916 /ORGANISM="Ceratium fusus, Strain PA161109" /LENGTH=62 /DNA_ID=CAMNT_0013516523 /DNA_START=26 /DNA_END=210 /DNA_ORIENTATION=-
MAFAMYVHKRSSGKLCPCLRVLQLEVARQTKHIITMKPSLAHSLLNRTRPLVIVGKQSKYMG